MNKFLIISLLAFLLIGCKCNNNISAQEKSVENKYIGEIKESELKPLLFEFASAEMKGREAGTAQELKATEFIKNFYEKNNIKPLPGTEDYYQKIPGGVFKGLPNGGRNVIAYIEGSDKKQDAIVISAHLDHLGFDGNKIYYGADDNGSGTVAVMSIAKAFKKAKDNGIIPRRSVIFLHFTGEEKGLYGSKYYTDNPLWSLGKTVTNLNIDMIGRIDEEHKNSPNYLYLIGSDKINKNLKLISEQINDKNFNLKLDYRFDAPNDPNRFYYRSDHYNFAKNKIPVIFYFNGTHEDYHQPTDTPDKINYELLTKRTQFIFATAWELANIK
ncbi:M28 family peptidase [Weeksellaceae bacterium TAE3-ERU29]|nr:M28 family peptidase [Weeksellaceae bacterium TAE3-ERU29]